jgi:hypothetical protein
MTADSPFERSGYRMAARSRPSTVAGPQKLLRDVRHDVVYRLRSGGIRDVGQINACLSAEEYEARCGRLFPRLIPWWALSQLKHSQLTDCSFRGQTGDGFNSTKLRPNREGGLSLIARVTGLRNQRPHYRTATSRPNLSVRPHHSKGHPPRYAAYLIPSSPSFPHSSTTRSR